MVDFRGYGYHLLFLAFASLAVYSFSLGHDFVPIWDDAMYVMANGAVRGLTLEHLRTTFTTNYSGNYAPLQIISYMFDYTLWGMNPSGFILTNIVLHTVNGLLFYVLLIRSRLDRPVACAAAFIFLLHPVQVESVVWISQRKSLLAMAFFLISFHCYLSYRATEESKKATFQYVLSLATFVMALLSKSVVVIMPLALMLHDRAFAMRRETAMRYVDKIPYALLAAIGAFGAWYGQDPQFNGGRSGFHGGSAVATFMTMLPVLMKYIRLIFWPTDLSLRYEMQVRAGFDEDVALAGLGVAALLAVGIYLFRCRREMFCWYALFFIGLLPVSQIVPIVTLMNDRYLYFPMLGAAPFVCVSVTLLIQSQPSVHRLLIVVCCTLLLPLPVLTYTRAAVWENSLTLWQDIVKKSPAYVPGWFNLADEYARRGDWDGALATSLKALEYFPLEPAVVKMAGVSYGKLGEVLKAREYLHHAATLSPADLEVLYLLVDNYLATGNRQEAASVYLAVLALNPGSERALEGLKNIRRQK